jgi:hypothetical protein
VSKSFEKRLRRLERILRMRESVLSPKVTLDPRSRAALEESVPGTTGTVGSLASPESERG